MAEAHPIPNSARFHNVLGQTFGNFYVVSFGGINKHGNFFWNCVCQICKQEKTIGLGCLKRRAASKENKPCGCWKGNLHSTPEYMTWRAIIERCINKNSPAYERYGKRGIKICPRWRKSFLAFLEDVGHRPSPDHSIDRFPDNNGNYEPDNIRWATAKEQARNRRSNTMITHNGQTLTLAEWSEITGFARDTIMARVKRGWSVSDALTKPLDLSNVPKSQL